MGFCQAREPYGLGISSIGALQCRSTKGVTSNVSPECVSIYSVMDLEDLPNTSLNTSSSFRFDTVRQFCARFFSPTSIQVSLNRYRTRSLRWRMSAGGIKEGFVIPHMNRSQIHLASFRSVLFPFCGFVYLGWSSSTWHVFSRILKTGIQYLPVDSMQTSVHLYFESHSDRLRSPFVKVENRLSKYSVRPFESVMPMQAYIQVLWTSSPQQFLRMILNGN